MNKLTKDQLRWLRQTGSLTFREMNILMEHYILGKSFTELREKYDLTLERVRQIQLTALKKISQHVNKQKVERKEKKIC